jgi:hypothetical protein
LLFVNAAFFLLLPILSLWLFITATIAAEPLLWCRFLVHASLPLTVRNYVVFDKLIPLRDNFFLELWIGNRDGATTKFTPEIIQRSTPVKSSCTSG